MRLREHAQEMASFGITWYSHRWLSRESSVLKFKKCWDASYLDYLLLFWFFQAGSCSIAQAGLAHSLVLLTHLRILWNSGSYHYACSKMYFKEENLWGWGDGSAGKGAYDQASRHTCWKERTDSQRCPLMPCQAPLSSLALRTLHTENKQFLNQEERHRERDPTLTSTHTLTLTCTCVYTPYKENSHELQIFTDFSLLNFCLNCGLLSV